jgi:hypothetical protein
VFILAPDELELELELELILVPRTRSPNLVRKLTTNSVVKKLVLVLPLDIKV